jgi:putative oxidoreductase
MLDRYFGWFAARAEWGPIFVRLAVAWMLIQGTQDNVFSHERMMEFAGFLQARGTPYPVFGAYLSAYAQFICGFLFALGLFTRPAAVVMTINFVCALVIAHRDTPFQATWPAIIMLGAALFLLFHGPGAFALDARGRTGNHR